MPSGDYRTWIGLYTTEKKFSIEFVQNFNPETAYGKLELDIETTGNLIMTQFNRNGVKTLEYKLKKRKIVCLLL